MIIAPGGVPGDSLEYPFLRIRNVGASATFIVKVLEKDKVVQFHFRSKIIRQTDDSLEVRLEEVDENFKSMGGTTNRKIQLRRQRGEDAVLIHQQGNANK